MKAFFLALAVALIGGGLSVGTARADDSADLSKQLADAQDKLSTALHSYTLLSDENAKLRDQADKAAADKAALQAQLDAAKQTIESLKASASTATQVDPLRDQLRQAQNQIASLAQENYELKRSLALSGPAPGAPAAPPAKAKSP